MRKTQFGLLVLLFCSSPSFAQDRWSVSVLATEGVSVGVAYAPVPQWDAELTVGTQSQISPYLRLTRIPFPDGSGSITYASTEYRDYRVTPLDFAVSRHFFAGERVQPYVRAGVRYVKAPDDPGPMPEPPATGPDVSPYVPEREGFRLEDRTSAQVGAGVRVRLLERLALRAEGTRLVRWDDVDFDALNRVAVGLSWAF